METHVFISKNVVYGHIELFLEASNITDVI